MKLQVEYFAILREKRGLPSEHVDTDSRTPRQLYAELQQQHRFPLAESALKVAVNEDFASWDSELKDGDTVVFIPPVAGG